jgi:adenine-specific DNA-methyltransferase
MAKLEDLIKQIPDPKLRAEIAREAATLKATKKFGLVFEDHIPEQVQLPNLAVQTGARVIKRGNGKQVFQVLEIKGKTARLAPEPQGQEETAKVDELVVVKNFGEPIYPTLTPRERVERAPDKPWHTIINADNFHALQLLLYCYEGMVDVIYIDPPYNTGARDWKYNNDYVDGNDQYRHSKWLAMMKKRLTLAYRLLKVDGILVIAIDDNEMHHLRTLMEDTFENINFLGCVTVRSKPSGNQTVQGFAVSHEFALFYGKEGKGGVNLLERSDDQLARFDQEDENGKFWWENLRRAGAHSSRQDRPKMFYPIWVKPDNSLVVPKMEWNQKEKSWIVKEKKPGNYIEVLPTRQNGDERIWSFNPDTSKQNLEELRADTVGDSLQIFRKRRMNRKGILPSTIWIDKKYSATEYGTAMVKAIFNQSEPFSYPKSLYTVQDCLRVASDNPDALILDFFAGSGTTLHATTLLNDEDNGQRRCILVTNNEVNEKTAKELNEKGIFVGQPEFEQYGICESITWPRSKYVINGKRDDDKELSGTYLNGREMKEGFEENIEYFRLDFLDPHDVAIGEKFESILPILWLMAGAQGKRENDKGEKGWFIPKNSHFAVLVDEHSFTQFKKAIASRSDLTHIFLVTDSLEGYQKMIAQLPEGVKTKMLYKSYLDNFKINIEQSL